MEKQCRSSSAVQQDIPSITALQTAVRFSAVEGRPGQARPGRVQHCARSVRQLYSLPCAAGAHLSCILGHSAQSLPNHIRSHHVSPPPSTDCTACTAGAHLSRILGMVPLQCIDHVVKQDSILHTSAQLYHLSWRSAQFWFRSVRPCACCLLHEF
jgi:hypothetical protein